MSLLKVENINKSYKAVHVLKNASIELNPGERHIIIGPNGAGKTTFFNCIYGTIPFDKGKIYLRGRSIGHLPSYKRVHLGMARTFQKNNLFEELTVEENVHLAILAGKRYKYNMFKPMLSHSEITEKTEEILREWEMWHRRNVPVNVLSYGEQRLLEIILSLCSNPEILLLDEPTSGMSPKETVKTMEFIQKIPRSVSILMIEHDMEVVFNIADRITVLHHGQTIMSAKPEEIRGDQMIQEIYFGGGALTGA